MPTPLSSRSLIAAADSFSPNGATATRRSLRSRPRPCEPPPPLERDPFELARTLLALGTVQRRAQHKRAARESLQQAAEIFERLGARLWLEKARSELRRIGGRTAPVGQLSETERRIVELVVAGRRNRQEVAAELNLSPNTVAWNLKKVYREARRQLPNRARSALSATPRA